VITAQDRAVGEQQLASDPHVSAFVEASAGSGKTKLLTDRVLRLMLADAPPGRIQCLTFTKAAAAEMALRLQRELGKWVTADDATLDAALGALQVASSRKTRERARQLFADVLDLPGGMRIGTIHAFAQSLLRRFPLEAAISPHFRLAEEADARITMQEAREGVLAAVPEPALSLLAGLARADELGGLVDILDKQRDRVALLPEDLDAAVRRTVGVTAGSERELLTEAAVCPNEAALVEALRLAAERGSPGVQADAARALDWLGQDREGRAGSWDVWHKLLIKADGRPCVFLNRRLAERHPGVAAVLETEQERVCALADARVAVRLADATSALLRVARPILGAYRSRKGELGLLDYPDLITRTTQLLQDPGAAWVLYKLDGGIDHLLLDEVQDTAPEQWKIAHRLTEEFFAGLGARSDAKLPRTFFAVGDPKQSIFSFQGAEPQEFDRARGLMGQRVRHAGEHWRRVTLDVSFRSTRPVLTLVDAVFAEGSDAAKGVVTGETLRHFANRSGDAGRVELWPLAPRQEPERSDAWAVLDRNRKARSAPQLLADTLADWIAEELRRAPPVASRNGRKLEPGDILILVQRRTQVAQPIVRALKARGVPVAGLDQLVLTEQLAVQDVLAACDAVLLPDDDLAVACVLTSPLGGLDDDGLMALALGRPATLWEALRTRAAERPDWAAAWAFLGKLQARADHVTPHALLAEALGPLGGRARLLARLGEEAAEPLDELLGAALSYTRLHAPSLQGFVHWIRRSGATVKREAGGPGRTVRVMTAHGAKGLQAPLVILPDTTALPRDIHTLLWSTDPATAQAVPLWAPSKEFCSERFRALRQEAREAAMAEYNRLLYVALTRAEDRLIVCGWDVKGRSEASWYAKVARGFEAIGAALVPFAPGWGEARALETRQAVSVPPIASREAAPAVLPAWAGRPGDWRAAPLPKEPALPVPLAPSRPEGALLGPVPEARSPLRERGPVRRFLRGTLVHELLQHLPALEPGRRKRAARAHLARHGLPPEEVEALAAQALAVLTHPDLAPLFGPAGLAEQPITGVAGGLVVTGKVDRMAVLPGEVLLADYKTGRTAPPDVADTPVLYLRQLASYRAVLGSIWRDRPVRCALVWTEAATVALIPSALLDAHAPQA